MGAVVTVTLRCRRRRRGYNAVHRLCGEIIRSARNDKESLIDKLKVFYDVGVEAV